MTSHVSTSPVTGSIEVACIQMQPVFGNVAANVAHSLELIDRAASRGANLAVLPELANTGYMFASREEAFGLAEPIPADRRCRPGRSARLGTACTSSRGSPNVPGLISTTAPCVIGPEGYIGTFRKVHLWNEENLYLRARQSRLSGVPHADRPHRRGDLLRRLVPGDFRLCALQGADIVCVPTNWVPIPGQAEGREAMANILAMAAAHSNSIFIACADRVGVERGQPFEGQSLIVSYTGWPVVGPASRDAEEILVAEVDLGEARRDRNWNAFNQVLRDRRADVYDEMLGSGAKRGWY